MKIVVWDPSGFIPDGEYVEGQEAKIERLGVIALPVDRDDIAQRNPLQGYFRRGWGHGWRFHRGIGERGCPMMLWTMPDRPVIHFACMLVGTGPEPRGKFRLATDSSYGALSGGLRADGPLSSFEIGNEMATKAHGAVQAKPAGANRWTFQGEAHMAATSEGYVALCLYGVAHDVAVVWTAVTQTR